MHGYPKAETFLLPPGITQCAKMTSAFPQAFYTSALPARKKIQAWLLITRPANENSNFFSRDGKRQLHYNLHGLSETFSLNESCKCTPPSGTDLKICFLLAFLVLVALQTHLAEDSLARTASSTWVL